MINVEGFRIGASPEDPDIHGLRHSLGNELYDLGIQREARKRMMAHESDAASLVYELGGNRSRQADKATRAVNRKHRGKR